MSYLSTPYQERPRKRVEMEAKLQEILKRLPVVQKAHICEPKIEDVAEVCYEAGCKYALDRKEDDADSMLIDGAYQRPVEKDKVGFPTLQELKDIFEQDNQANDHEVGLQGVVEIAFKAGMEKVVEYIRETDILTMLSPRQRERWQAFLKENGR